MQRERERLQHQWRNSAGKVRERGRPRSCKNMIDENPIFCRGVVKYEWMKKEAHNRVTLHGVRQGLGPVHARTWTPSETRVRSLAGTGREKKVAS